ncbi:hypothetical protein COLO4_12221 [Corchorus olitorius]|uniref:Uncharacterized protein n=1 Tax=Corchorus olitorius TaxID=93759 RepID=A0A1R3K1N6_9ROSI|nr:hypothetical protein COLO4_12221 [Corchorus olitorius]
MVAENCGLAASLTLLMMTVMDLTFGDDYRLCIPYTAKNLNIDYILCYFRQVHADIVYHHPKGREPHMLIGLDVVVGHCGSKHSVVTVSAQGVLSLLVLYGEWGRQTIAMQPHMDTNFNLHLDVDMGPIFDDQINIVRNNVSVIQLDAIFLADNSCVLPSINMIFHEVIDFQFKDPCHYVWPVFRTLTRQAYFESRNTQHQPRIVGRVCRPLKVYSGGHVSAG